MTAHLWYQFKILRAIIFALSVLLSLAWTVVFTTFLLREWSSYNNGQRALVIVLLGISALSAIFMYLMIVVHFKLRLDAVRVAFVLFFQLGSTVSFALFSPSFPCNNIGTEADCKRLTSATIVGGWSLSGLLLFYAFCLVAMSYVPPSSPPPNPEAGLSAHASERSFLGHTSTPSVSSETWLLKPDEKRQSLGTFRCRGPSTPVPSLRSLPSVTYRAVVREHLGRPESPASSYRSRSSSWDSRSDRQSPTSHSRPQPQSLPQRYLPNPFADPIHRSASPLSTASLSSFRTGGHTYEQGSTFGAPPIPNTAPASRIYNGSNFPPPPYFEGRRAAYIPNNPFDPLASPNSLGHLVVPSTPMSLRPAVKPNASREYTASPAVHSVRSMSASLHAPSRSASYSSSRTPSPLSSGLPAFPRLAASPHGSFRARDASHIRRYGSDSSIGFFTQDPARGTPHPSLQIGPRMITPPNQQIIAGLPEWVVAKADHTVDFKQWRENVLGAAHGRPVVS